MERKSAAISPLRWVWRISAGTRWEVLLLLILNVISGGSGVALAAAAWRWPGPFGT